MKKFLFDFGYKRNVLGAIGFYVLYMVLSLLLTGIVGALVGGRVSTEEAASYGASIGRVMSVVMPVLFSLLILKAKKLFKDSVGLGVLVLAGAVGFFVGLVLAFIPVAFLTTRKPK